MARLLNKRQKITKGIKPSPLPAFAADLSNGLKLPAIKRLDSFDKSDNDILINFTDDLLWSVGPDLKLITANNVFIRYMKEASGITLKPGDDLLTESVFPQEFLAFWELSYKRALAGESFKKEIYTPGFNKGKAMWTETSFNPIYKADNIAGVACFSRNITERKKADEAIQKAFEERNTILERIDDGFFATDEHSVVTFWNKRAETLLKAKREEMIGKNLHEVFATHTSLVFYNHYQKAIRENTTVHFVEFSTRTNKWFAVSAYASDNGLSVYFKDVTEQKNAEEKLKESELRYRSLIENASDTICITDASMKFIDINPNGCKMFGYSREEFLQFYMTDVLFAEDLVTNPIKLNELNAGKSTVNERRVRRKDGSSVLIELSGKMLEDGNIIIFGRDITERKKAENKILESELRYRSIIEQATDAICIADASMKIMDVNPYCCQMLGYAKEEFLMLSVADLFLPEDLKANPFKIAELQSGKIIRNERRFKRKDGTIIDVEMSGRVLEDGRFIVFGHDIAERKKAEDELKASELRYRSLNEQATDAICITDASMRFININPYGCEIFGYTEEEALQLSLPDILFTEDLHDNPIRPEKLKLGKIVRNERRLKKKDGTAIDMEVSTKLMEDGTMIMFGHDITERKQAEVLIKESETKYRNLFEQNMTGLYQTTASGVIVNCNNAFAKMLKYDSPAELQKINAAELYFSNAERNNFTNNVITEKNITDYESVLKCKGGSPMYFVENVSLQKDEITGEEFFNGIMIDITEKRQAELQLIESNKRYNLISKATNDMVWDWDLITGKVYRNKEGWKKIFRTGENEIEKEDIQNWDDRIHPEDIEKVKLVTDELLIPESKKDFYEVECRMLRDDGTYVHVHDRGYIMRNDKGIATRLIGATQDITERKEAELQVIKSEIRFRSLVQNSSELICIFNERGYFMYSSPAIKHMLGFEPEETIEKNVFGLVHPDDINTLKDYLSQMKPFSHNDMPLLRFINTRGEWRWIESKVTDMSDNPEVAGYVFNCRDVTERKLAEENLVKTSAELQHALTEQVSLRKKTEDSETRLKEAQAIAHLGHWNLDFATQIAFWSEEACRIYGLPSKDNKQSYASWVSFIHPEDVDYVMKVTTESQKTLSDTTLRHRIVLKDGTVKYITAKSKFVFDENGKPVGLHGVSHDVTESKIAEEEIKKLSIIAQETSNAVIITNPAGEIVWVNEGFSKITEYAFEEVIGKKPGHFLQGKETNQAVVRFMRNKLKNIEPFQCDLLNYSKSGKKYWLRIQSQPQFDETGKLKYFFAIETDITKEKEAEEILKTSEERYRYLFNNNPASIIIWDLETLQILEVNMTAMGLYGYSREEFVSKTVLELSLSEDYNKIKHFASIAQQKNEFRSELNCRHINKAGEEMHMHISSHLIQFKGRPVILALATDVTDKIILEKELEKERLLKHQEITKAVISAQEQERQELGGELHDNVNQILAGSLLYLGLAKKELNIDHAYLTETDTLVNLAIKEIRNLSHSLIPPSLHESEFLDALKNLIESIQKSSGIFIKLQAREFDESNIPDKLKLTIYRIVQEQLNNILKHASAEKVIVHLVQDNEKTLLSIKDDGVGFDSTKKSNGVGLMNIKTRASLFNGDIAIISSPGKGCELRVFFN